MTILLALAALVSSASPEASPSAGPPPLAEALAKAKATGRPLVLEVSTTWCEPCKQFDAEILPAPEVVRALHDVTFVQYDAEKEPGRGAAATFAVSSYPTFLALDAAGVLRERQLGVSDADDFIAFLTRSLAVTLDAASIEARVRAAPNDPQTLLTAARWHATHEHTAEARSHYAKAAASDPRGQVAPEAAWELTGLDQRVRAGASLLEYAARFPSARRAPTAMALGALAGHASPDKVRATLSAYVAANRDDVSRLLEIVTVALAAGAIDSAEAAARRLVELGPGDADACALLAEVHHQRGDKARAVQAADKCLLLAGADRARIEASHARFTRGTGETSPEVNAARSMAQEFFAGLADPVFELEVGDAPPPDIAAIMGFELEARAALAGAGQVCAPVAGKLTEAWVRVELPDKPGRPKKVWVLEPGAPVKLRACLLKDLSARQFPAAPPEQQGFALGGGVGPAGRYNAAVPLAPSIE
ncbi:MAG: thioredoxin family protein [Deltaproteobacteria bacterium]|nr:thioredoxin family protein [Deltaproteobacteria bacterium]